jgi:UDP-N-acetylglucosamine--N-acetylmuramyl-(pentapeptide) pyrophosphoryl-undecaprenol N-acetylglucosamine transferase
LKNRPKERLRVLIAGGGSGGHVIPALAVARALVERENAQVRMVGTARGMETRLVPAAGFPLDLIQIGQFNQVKLAIKLKTAARLPLAVLACIRILRKFRPHVVFSVGGYASGPAMLAAILTRTPRVAFEPNAVPGMANRAIGKWVQAAAVNFSETLSCFHNAHVTGIPVRPEFFFLPARSVDAPPRLLVFGGSQGARVLNQIMPRIAARLLDAVPGLTIVHQCGARHEEGTRQAYLQCADLRAFPASAWSVEPFFDDMPQQIASASLVLCRSGASTVAELAAASKPSLLIPFPRSADDHQRRNAEVFVRAGAAAMILETELTPDRLSAELIALLTNPEALATMGRNARHLAHEDAAASIVTLLKQQQPA